MPSSQFDELAKELAKPNLSRRRVLRALALIAVGGLFPFLRGNVNSQAPALPASTPSKVYLPVVFGAPCGAGLTNCNGTCVDLQTNVNNCGACGTVCSSASHATGSCMAGACGLICDVGYANCDGNSANGCECEGTGCCGSSCQTKHSNGLGQNYFDCGALGTPGIAATYSFTMATEAANAYPTVDTVNSATCSGASAVYKQGTNYCAVWTYTGVNSGHVHLNNVNNTCYCPSGSDPTWN